MPLMFILHFAISITINNGKKTLKLATQQIKAIDGRIKRLFSYSKLRLLNDPGKPPEPASFESLPESSEKPPEKSLVTPAKTHWESSQEKSFFNALNLQLKTPAE